MQSVVHENSDGDQNISALPWLLIEKQRNVTKELIQKIKYPTGFSSNINNILTKKGEFGGAKTYDWLTVIKVTILVFIFLYLYTSIFCFFCILWE